MYKRQVVSVNVINPGEGYAVLPEIRIDPAVQLFFTNADINSTLHTISLFAPNLATGDLIQYKDSEDGASVTRLINNQWYYVNVLETNPTALVALYPSYADAVNEMHRIKFTNATTDGSFALNLGARASAISSASPVREVVSTLRYDRTTYTSQILDWEANAFYGSFFAGSYFNSENVSSSAIKLQSTQPPINSIEASAQGAIFSQSPSRAHFIISTKGKSLGQFLWQFPHPVHFIASATSFSVSGRYFSLLLIS